VNRRAFLKTALSSAAVAPLAFVPAPTVEAEERFGRVTAQDANARWYRAFLNDVEVTSRCSEADDKAGYVDLFEEDDRRVNRRHYGAVHIEIRAHS
jgi:hypothetical protein